MPLEYQARAVNDPILGRQMCDAAYVGTYVDCVGADTRRPGWLRMEVKECSPRTPLDKGGPHRGAGTLDDSQPACPNTGVDRRRHYVAEFTVGVDPVSWTP